jgi:peptide/nickel transport system substrate-binding protein
MNNNLRNGRFLLAIFTIIAIILSACGKPAPDSTVLSTSTVVAKPMPIATPVTLKKLTVCLAEEPQSLYLYGSSTQATWSVLEAIYDGPIDTKNNEPVPVILNTLPTLDNGGVTLQSVAVTRGDKVANIEGDVVALQKGVKVFPEGCTTSSCAVEWDGTSDLKVSQMTATFKLLPNLKWSDGEPLTAADSVYSYQLTLDPGGG